MFKSYINKIIKKHRVISFDIFDTLLERNVDTPTDIFEIVGKKNGLQASFKEDRVVAEKKARIYNNGEVTLDDIYKFLPDYLNDKKEIIKQSEIDTEINSVKLKHSMKDIYDYAIKQNKQVYLISDMYLPSYVIKRMLDKIGIDGYKKIYISNEYGCDKISARLFETVIGENNIVRSEMVHIGDSIKADLIGARKAKIHSVLIGRKNRLKRIVLKYGKKSFRS